MGITVAWDNDAKTAIYYELSGVWTWEDYWVAIKAGTVLLDTVDYKICTIMDLRKSRSLPPNTLGEIKRILTFPRHRNLSITVLVGANTFMQSMANAASRLNKAIWGNYDMVFTATLEEARAI